MPAKKVDLNTGSEKDLQELPGVGEVTAKKIVAGRPYTSVEGLSKAGVSESEIARISELGHRRQDDGSPKVSESSKSESKTKSTSKSKETEPTPAATPKEIKGGGKGPGLGQHLDEGLPHEGRSLVRHDEGRQVHDRR